MARDVVRPRLVGRPAPLGPHGVKRLRMRRPWCFRPKQEIEPRLLGRLGWCAWPRVWLGPWPHLGNDTGMMTVAVRRERNVLAIGDDPAWAHRRGPQPLQRRTRDLDSGRRRRLGWSRL